MNLSKRLSAVAAMVTPGLRVADIGTDHGYIPIYLTTEHIAPHAFAMDVNEGPLSRATENISRYEANGLVTTRRSDGLRQLEVGEVESIVIAGMGGMLTIRILEDSPLVASSARELILSPHSDVDLVRVYLAEHGFAIMDESMVEEDDKYYFILKAMPGNMQIPSGVAKLYGDILPARRDFVLKDYLEKELRKRQGILSRLEQNAQAGQSRILEVEAEMALIQEALHIYGIEEDN